MRMLTPVNPKKACVDREGNTAARNDMADIIAAQLTKVNKQPCETRFAGLGP
jgi:hypothetical protein